MSLRGYRIYTFNDNNYHRILVESVKNNSYLYIENGCIATLGNNEGDKLKNTFSKIADGCGILGILRLSAINDSYLILITEVKSVGKLHDCDIVKISAVKFLSLNREPFQVVDERIPELAKLLSSENFYYALSNQTKNLFDLTLSSQSRNDPNTVDYRFFWNRNLYFPLERFGINPDDWFVRCMCGSVIIRTIYVGHRTGKVGIISRLSCERVGTRFNVRGANDDGSVANFVESEQFISLEEKQSSFIQIRGSVPLFWEQPGIQVGSHSIKMKSIETSVPAFERHYAQLKRLYNNIATVNLLGFKEGEKKLSEAFKTVHKGSSHCETEFISFDYHAQMKISKSNIKILQSALDPIIERNGYYFEVDGKINKLQSGVLRTNCMDCLDRTNCVQTLIGLKALTIQLADLDIERLKTGISSRFEETLKEMWQKNGDQCSVIYAGTGALEGKSKLKDASRSIARSFQNNLMDSAKQESFDLFLLGNGYFDDQFDKASRFLPPQMMKVSSYVTECPDAIPELLSRKNEMTLRQNLSVFVGTWNVNGGKNLNNVAFKHENSFEEWFYGDNWTSGNIAMHDIVAIGLEEIVDLNASNLVKASTTNQRIFCETVRQTLCRRSREKYIVVACEQLVGVCLIICVRIHLLPRIKGLALSDVKTGMGGATGNKGSIAARMTIDSTSICFVCSHFAAGQHEVQNRNEDFATTIRKLKFPQGRSINSHDVVFWFGDFNYRISLSAIDIKRSVEAKDYDTLVVYDQLTEQRLAGNVFQGYQESKINFAPTYKYDTFSDDYDTSEKCRAPAWTDRILWQDEPNDKLVKLIEYRRSEIRTSDHRPVGAVFQLDVLKVDLKKCENVFRDVVASLGPPDCIILCSVYGCQSFPMEYCNSVLQKLDELCISHSLLAVEDPFLKIGFSNGPSALAAISMDGAEITDGKEVKNLSVQLRSPDWEDDWTLRLAPSFKREPSCINLNNIEGLSIVNLNIDEDEDDTVSLASARSYNEFDINRASKVEEQILVRSSAPFLTTQPPPPPPRPSNIPINISNGNESKIPVIPPRPNPANWQPKFT